MLVKTEVVCPEVWGERERIALLPPLRMDDRLFLNFVIPEVGEVNGLFVVTDVLHIHEGRGYVQRLRVQPE